MRTSHQHARPPRTTCRIVAAVIITATLVALPRFGHTTPDSVYYVTMTDYFRGLAARADLQSPFAFRWVVPWLASWLDGLSASTAIALISLISMLLAYLCLARLLARLLPATDQYRAGVLLLIFSFPTINYGGAVLTDSAGFFVLSAAACAMVERRMVLLALMLVVGMGVRETTLLMIPACWIYLALERDRHGMLTAATLTITALTAAMLYRWCFSDLTPYYWTPDGDRLINNLTRPVSWATLALTVGPIGTLAFASRAHWDHVPTRTRHFIIALGLPALALLGYSILAAFMSGRFGWPLYLALLPLVAGGQPIWDSRGWMAATERALFGPVPRPGSPRP